MSSAEKQANASDAIPTGSIPLGFDEAVAGLLAVDAKALRAQSTPQATQRLGNTQGAKEKKKPAK